LSLLPREPVVGNGFPFHKKDFLAKSQIAEKLPPKDDKKMLSTTEEITLH